jgi:hypothetical protein
MQDCLGAGGERRCSLSDGTLNTIPKKNLSTFGRLAHSEDLSRYSRTPTSARTRAYSDLAMNYPLC